jgi:pyruvate/2-oxoglutarate dehydrogenase complex dihydrolipoamide acyltransferase (E2) component
MTASPLPRERRHTLHFLDGVRAWTPVFLDTEIDMGQVQEHRAAGHRRGRHYSLVTYVLYTAARTLVAHPQANAAIRGRRRPRVARYASASGKLALDKTVNGQRVVLAAILPDLDRASLDEIQLQVDRYRDGDPARMPEFARVRALDRLPMPLGRFVFRLGLHSLRNRPAVMGTFAVTSLGHRPVDSFHSVGGTTVTLGVGRVADRPVARAGRVEIAPIMRLSLAFDHRVIDGAEAADILADLRDSLEHFQAGAVPAPHLAPASGADGVPG